MKQGIDKLTFYIMRRNQQDIRGTPIEANLEMALLYVGISRKEIFELDYKAFSDLLPRL